MTKKTFWHIVSFVGSIGESEYKLHQIVGYEEKKTEIYGCDDACKGFSVKAKLAYLGSLPAAYHEDYPEEASSRLDIWRDAWLSSHHVKKSMCINGGE